MKLSGTLLNLLEIKNKEEKDKSIKARQSKNKRFKLPVDVTAKSVTANKKTDPKVQSSKKPVENTDKKNPKSAKTKKKSNSKDEFAHAMNSCLPMQKIISPRHLKKFQTHELFKSTQISKKSEMVDSSKIDTSKEKNKLSHSKILQGNDDIVRKDVLDRSKDSTTIFDKKVPKRPLTDSIASQHPKSKKKEEKDDHTQERKVDKLTVSDHFISKNSDAVDSSKIDTSKEKNKLSHSKKFQGNDNIARKDVLDRSKDSTTISDKKIPKRTLTDSIASQHPKSKKNEEKDDHTQERKADNLTVKRKPSNLTYLKEAFLRGNFSKTQVDLSQIQEEDVKDKLKKTFPQKEDFSKATVLLTKNNEHKGNGRKAVKYNTKANSNNKNTTPASFLTVKGEELVEGNRFGLNGKKYGGDPKQGHIFRFNSERIVSSAHIDIPENNVQIKIESGRINSKISTRNAKIINKMHVVKLVRKRSEAYTSLPQVSRGAVLHTKVNTLFKEQSKNHEISSHIVHKISQAVIKALENHKPPLKLEIKLNPPKLGKVSIIMVEKGGKTILTMNAEKLQTQELLRMVIPIVVNQLSNLNFNVVSVQLNAQQWLENNDKGHGRNNNDGQRKRQRESGKFSDDFKKAYE